MADPKENKQRNPHCLIFPFPMQGHINPMVQFAKRLLHKGLHLTLILTKHMASTTPFSSSAMNLETISDGLDDGAPSDMSLNEYVTVFTEFGPRSLRETIQKLKDADRSADCIIYDSFINWVPALAKEAGVTAATFFTQSCAVDYIYNCVFTGSLKIPLPAKEIALPGLPLLQVEDMPTLLNDDSSSGSIVLETSIDQFRNLDDVSWIFFNTFYELEKEVIDYMSNCTPVKPIGPTIPSIYIDKRLPEDREYGFNVFRPNSDICMDWLNRQEPESVVYVSFGSLAKISEEQIEELAWGLKLCEKPFLWVVRSSEQSKLKLPLDFSQEKGLIISWSPQLDVLAHDAVSCFVTHCGWNSTLEALCLGVPMVAMPQWSDQNTNSKFVMDVWKTGVRASGGENGLISRETIERCIREVMEGDKGEEMKKNAAKWKEIARAAMDEGGSSDTNIQHFVSSLSF